MCWYLGWSICRSCHWVLDSNVLQHGCLVCCLGHIMISLRFLRHIFVVLVTEVVVILQSSVDWNWIVHVY